MQIITDNGPEFTSMISRFLQDIHNCKLIFTTPYHPQTNGLVESAHKALKKSLIKLIGEKSEDWFHYLEQVTFSLNIRPRNTTNYSAFELMNGCRKHGFQTKLKTSSSSILTYSTPMHHLIQMIARRMT